MQIKHVHDTKDNISAVLSQKYDISSLNMSVEDVVGKPVTNEVKNLPVKYEKHSWFTNLIEKIKRFFKK